MSEESRPMTPTDEEAELARVMQCTRIILSDTDAEELARAILAAGYVKLGHGTCGVDAPDGKPCDYIDTGAGCVVSWGGRLYLVDKEGDVDFSKPIDFGALLKTRDAALEEAAKACDVLCHEASANLNTADESTNYDFWQGASVGAEESAARIRALKAKR